MDPKEQDPPCVFGSSWGFSFFKDKPLEFEFKITGGNLVTPAAQSKKSQLKTKYIRCANCTVIHGPKTRGKFRVLY